MMKHFLAYGLLFCLLACNKVPLEHKPKDNLTLINYVNPFIGTGGHGHTFPGATMPFGMMQLSPDTRLEGWDGCSGYHYSDEYIYGFSHTHLSGTGISDYGDVLLMPTNKIIFKNGADGKPGYKAHFSHSNETAEPGFYKVHLDTTDIDVELTVSKRSGIHKYHFPKAQNQYVILDLQHRDQLLNHKINLINNFEINGYRHSKAWAKDQRLYYHMVLSHPIEKIIYEDSLGQTRLNNKDSKAKKAALLFQNPDNEPVTIKVGISAVDAAGAFKNLKSEILQKDFGTVKTEAKRAWEDQLSKITIESDDINKTTNFYTALYHTMIAPNLYQDVDGRYRGMDFNIHKTFDFDYYTVFSLWDTYRATHPLYTIIETEKTNDFINTFLAKYEEGGRLPMWDLAANYTNCMIGYHAAPVIADAYLKGIDDFDADKALEAMKHSSNQNKFGLRSFRTNGFIPVDEESESVSKTLEYAYDDWTIAQMAKAMNRPKDYKTYMKRAQYYKNVFDPETNFMRGRFRNTWFSPFDPFEVNFNYTEANAWQYSTYVPHDISGLMNLMGGKTQLETHLDKLFSAKTTTSGRDQADITGLIGQYAHGNEPSHHMAYLYNFVNKPHKTQERVHEIINTLYHNSPDGISGNEDCGQMSAWYVFSSLGFYPVTPGNNQYTIGTPTVKKAMIYLENGKNFTVEAHELTNTNKYISRAILNNKPLNRTFLNHEEIMEGGTLEFFMTDKPSNWGSQWQQAPKTEIKEHLILPSPYIERGDVTFRDQTKVILNNSDKGAQIYYALNDGKFQLYKEPFTISRHTEIKMYAEKDQLKSPILTTPFYKINPNLSIILESDYANQYSAGGDDALIDGIRSTKNYRTGSWQGYWNTDMIATVDLGEKQTIYKVEIAFLQDQGAWIFLPREVQILTSSDGINFTKHTNWKFKSSIEDDTIKIEKVKLAKLGNARYVKVIAKKLGNLPTWHIGHDMSGKSWIFVDEIAIN